MKQNKLIYSLNDLLKIERHTKTEDSLWSVYLPAFLEINADIFYSIDKYFKDKSFFVCNPSVLAGVLGACENFDTVFKIKKAEHGYQFLSQTAQLQLERLLSFNIDKVASINKSFRDESITNDGRHLKEFTLVEIEIANCELSKLLDTIEDFIKFIACSLLSNRDGLLKKIYDIDIKKKSKQFIDKAYARITYDEAIKLLRKSGTDINWGDDLNRFHEQFIAKEMGEIPTFITHFPADIKFFNMRVNRKRKEIVNSADLILPISGEAVGSAEREFDYEILIKRFEDSQMYAKMKDAGVTIKDLGCYFKIVKKNDIPKHAGCGIGMERVLQALLSPCLTDIRLFSQAYILNRVLGIF